MEGTFNNDPSIGFWPTTSLRVMRGFGIPTEDLWPYDGDASHWPPKSEPTNIDHFAKQHRIFAYQRVRDSQECKLVLASKNCPIVAVEITASWFDAEQGQIHLPRSNEAIIGSHSVTLAGYDDSKGSFIFRNSWGVKWGDKGYGYLPYEYLDLLVLEGLFIHLNYDSPRQASTSRHVEFQWSRKSILNGVLHGIELQDNRSDDRIAWTFAVAYDGFLNVEEFFIMPSHRHQGHSKMLFQSLLTLSNRLSLPLRVWISHADSEDDNMRAILHLAQTHNLQVSNPSVRWASFMLLNGGTRGLNPIPRIRPGVSFPSRNTLPI